MNQKLLALYGLKWNPFSRIWACSMRQQKRSSFGCT